MLKSRVVILMFAVGAMLLGAGGVSGQDYPNKPLRMITGAAGGGADFLTRLAAQEISGPLGQRVIVENRGGSPVVVLQPLLKAPADGYTLLMFCDCFWILPFMQDVPYDAVKDLAPISRGTTMSNIVTVHSSVPVKSVKELIALAKAKPGGLSYGYGAAGSSLQMAPELFNAMAGVKIVPVAYKGAAAMTTALLSGEVNVAFPSAASMIPHIKSDKIRPLAVTSLKRSPLFPELPTLADSGLSGFEAGSVFAFFAKAGTSPAIIKRLNQEIVRVLERPDIKEKLAKLGLESGGSTPEQLAAFVKADMAKWGKVIKDAGLRPPK